MGRFVVGKSQLAFFAVLFLSISTLAGGSIAGKVTIVKGQVFIVRGSEKIQVKKDITVLESDVIESQAGGTARITMIDSNLVDVYPKSKVEIAKYVYKPNEDKKDVELKVDFGKIKSTVNQKYDGAKNKYQVKTPSAVAGVRGTVFTTEYDAVKKVSRVTTIEGLVAVTKMLDRGERQAPPVFVRPNQEVKLNIESAKAEQPRDLKTEERDERKKEDKNLGYQYDPKNEPTPAVDGATSKFERPGKDIQPVKEVVKDIDSIQPPKVVIDKEPVREAPPVSVREIIKDKFKEASERREQREQEKQERRQTASEEEQAKKQKQLEEEQAKKQKQLEEEQARKQKQAEEEQAKKQKQLEDEQARKQKQAEEEQTKKQKQLEDEQSRKQKQAEEEQARRQKNLEEEQAKKQRLIEELLAAKRKQAEEAQAKREEEQNKRAQEIAQRRAELARRLAEIAKRAEDTNNRLPSGSSGSSPSTTLPGSILPIKN